MNTMTKTLSAAIGTGTPQGRQMTADWPASAGIAGLAELAEPSPQGGRTEGPRTVSICDTQPVTAEGIRTLLSGSQELEFLETTDSLRTALEHVRLEAPSLLLLDKAFGIQAILDWLADFRSLEVSGTP